MITIHADNSGNFADPNDRKAITYSPIRRLVLFAHGWQTSDTEEAEHIAAIESSLLPLLAPMPTLAIAIRWPSQFCGFELFNLPTFYADKALADMVGAKVGRDLIEIALENTPDPLEIVVMGHSFGCRVACSAIASVTDGFGASKVKAILLQAAFAANELDPGQPYGKLAALPVEILATTSAGDRALGCGWELAEPRSVALGDAGPTMASQTAYGPRLRAMNILPWQQSDQEIILDRHSQVWTVPELWTAEADFVNDTRLRSRQIQNAPGKSKT